MKASSMETSSVVFVVGLMIVGFGGWVANIVKLSSMAAEPLTTMFIMRIIGIFVAPIGSILGFL